MTNGKTRMFMDEEMNQSVVLCQQVKMIDFTERGLQFVEKAPESVTNDALAKVRAIVVSD